MTKQTKKTKTTKTDKAKKTEVAKNTDVEVVEAQAVAIVRNEADLPALAVIEDSIRRDILIGAQLDKASAMVSIKIGLALGAAKVMLRRGEYGPWLDNKFGESFGARKAQYCQKLANIFSREMQGKLVLPAPKETGNWLAVQNEGSTLATNVAEFVGELSFSELLEKHRIKVAPSRGGWRPSDMLLNRFIGEERKDLAGIDFQAWSDADKDQFRAWAEANDDSNSAEARAMAAEGTWSGIRSQLEEHGMARASWKLLGEEDLQNVAAVLKDVYNDINKALKALAKSK